MLLAGSPVLGSRISSNLSARTREGGKKLILSFNFWLLSTFASKIYGQIKSLTQLAKSEWRACSCGSARALFLYVPPEAIRPPQPCLTFDPKTRRDTMNESPAIRGRRVFQMQAKFDRVTSTLPKRSRLACHFLPCCAIFFPLTAFFFAHRVQEATQVQYTDKRVLFL
jgi:hypothetical protein